MSGQPFQILLVEDSPLDARVIRESFLEVRTPHTLHVVTDGEKALSFLHRGVEYADAPRPDLVLLDLNLPEVTGFEVLAAIKEHEHLRDIPVIVLTGSQNVEDVCRAYELQANCYVEKPHDVAAFLDLARAIDHFWLQHAVLPSSDRRSATTR